MILLKTSNCEIEWGYHIVLGGSVTAMSPEYLCLKLYTQAVFSQSSATEGTVDKLYKIRPKWPRWA